MDDYTRKRLLAEAEVCAIEYDLVLSEMRNRLEEDTTISESNKSLAILQLVEANRNLEMLRSMIPKIFETFIGR